MEPGVAPRGRMWADMLAGRTLLRAQPGGYGIDHARLSMRRSTQVMVHLRNKHCRVPRYACGCVVTFHGEEKELFSRGAEMREPSGQD